MKNEKKQKSGKWRNLKKDAWLTFDGLRRQIKPSETTERPFLLGEFFDGGYLGLGKFGDVRENKEW